MQSLKATKQERQVDNMGYWLKDINTTKRLLKIYVDNLKLAVKATDVVKEAVKNFDGKVMNVRFINAIKEAVEKSKMPLYAYDSHNRNIVLGFRNDCFVEGCCAIYISYRNVYITNNYNSNNDYVDNDNRIKLSRFYELLDVRKGEIEKEIVEIEKGIKDLEKIAKKHAEIMAEIDTFNRQNYVVLKELDAYISVNHR